MRAGDIIGQDFQLWSRMNEGIFGQQKIVVCLARIGLLSVLLDTNVPSEHPGRFSVKNALVELTASTAGLRMGNRDMGIDKFLSMASV
jgi:hypothetical protein